MDGKDQVKIKAGAENDSAFEDTHLGYE